MHQRGEEDAGRAAERLPAEARDQVAARRGQPSPADSRGGRRGTAPRTRYAADQPARPTPPSPAAAATRAPPDAGRAGRRRYSAITVPTVSLSIVVSAPAKRAVPDTRCWLVSSLTALVSAMPGSSTISDGDDHGVQVERRDEAGDQRSRRSRRPSPAIASQASCSRGRRDEACSSSADQQADQAGGGDVQPRQPQQAGDRAPRPGRTRAPASRAARRLGGLVQRAAVAAWPCGDVELPGHHVLGDAVGLAQPVQVGFARRQADHAGGVAVAGRARRIAEGQDHAGRVRPRLAFQPQLLRDRARSRLPAAARWCRRRAGAGPARPRSRCARRSWRWTVSRRRRCAGRHAREGSARGAPWAQHASRAGRQPARVRHAAMTLLACSLLHRIPHDQRMTATDAAAPDFDRRRRAIPSRLRLSGQLDPATTPTAIGERLREAPPASTPVDATARRPARLGRRAAAAALRRAATASTSTRFAFRDDHRALVSAIEDVADDRPQEEARIRRRRRARAPGLRGAATTGRKSLRAGRLLRRDPGQAGAHVQGTAAASASPPPCTTWSRSASTRCRWWRCCRFLVGAVIAFLGANILRDFGAEIFVVELVSIAFLREFGVLLTAIMLAGRTASAFTAQIGAMTEPRGDRRDPHARPGPDRPAGDPARARAAGDAAAADLHRDGRRPRSAA